jgi:hypothetical protein
VEASSAHREELHECRQCCSFCDRLVQPAGCIEAGCAYLYLYDDEETGKRFMGCMNHGFGGVKMSGVPLPQCRTTVEKAYDGHGDAFDCTNPGFFQKPEQPDPAFDIRDQL